MPCVLRLLQPSLLPPRRTICNFGNSRRRWKRKLEASLQPSQSDFQSRVIRSIKKCGVIACLRAPSGDLALDLARNVLDEGIPVLEITMNTPKALKVLERLVEEYPSAIIGVGTILTLKDAKDAESAGAQFLMSPTTIKEILKVYEHGPISYIPGAMTPTEVLDAYSLGAQIIKVYPVSILGGAKYINALKTPFHHIPMIASQGITMDAIELYINLGASAVVLSDAIFQKSAVANKDLSIIRRLATVALRKSETAVRSVCRPK